MQYSKKLALNIKLFYINSIFNGLIGILAPIIVIFQMKELGLTMGEVLLGEAIMAAAVLITEIPSGIFADKFGRKKCLLWAEFLVMSSFLTLTLAQNFTHVIIGQILIGIAMAFSSGAKNALIFDSLKELSREMEFKSILGKLNTITFTIAIGSNIAAGFLASGFGLRLPLLLSSIFAGISLINIFCLTETKIQYKKIPDSTLWKHFKDSGHTILKNKMLPFLILFSTIIGIGMKISFHTLNPYWELMGIPMTLFGIALASHNALAALISAFGHRIIAKFGDIKILWILLGLICFTFGLMSGLKLGIIGAIAISALFQIPRALIPMTIDDILHQSTESHQRATVLSMHSFSKQGAQALMLPIFGYGADILGLLEAFFWLAFILLILGSLHLIPIQKLYKK